MKKTLSLLLALILCMSVCAGAFADESLFVSDKAFTLNINTNQKSDEELALIEAAVNVYKQMYPNCELKINYGVDTADLNDYATRLLSQFASGEDIDIIWMAVEGIAFLAGNEVIAPLDQYIETNESLKARITEDVAAPVLACMQYNGQTYGLPLGWNNTLLMYNTKMFEEAGLEYKDSWTWDEFLDAAQKLTHIDANGEKVFGLALNFNLSDYLPFLAANGTFDMSEDLSASWWNKQETIDTFQFIVDLVNKYQVCVYPEKTYYSSYFRAGRIAMMMGGPWAISSFEGHEFYDYDFMNLPSSTGTTKGCSFGGDGYCLTTACKNPEEAVAFMELLTNDDIQMMMARLGTSSPSTKSAAYSEEFLAHTPHVSLHYDIVLDPEANSRVISSPVFRPEMENTFSEYWAKCLAGEITVEEMCMSMHEAVEEMIAEQ